MKIARCEIGIKYINNDINLLFYYMWLVENKKGIDGIIFGDGMKKIELDKFEITAVARSDCN